MGFLLLWSTLAGGLDLSGRTLPLSPLELRDQRVRRSFHLMQGPEAHTLEMKRQIESDWRFAAPTDFNVLGGLGLFGFSLVAAAHAPERLRPLFDGTWHLGPAILDGGAMGAGFGGRWW